MPIDANLKDLASGYNEKYVQGDFFKYKAWLYRPFVRALIAKTGLTSRSKVLDIGCGQGFFSSLLADLGLMVTGLDVSEEAIRSAKRKYGGTGVHFETGVASCLHYHAAYDCIFVRALSSYNSKEFKNSNDVTDALLAHLKPGGIMIFAYPTNLCPSRGTGPWIHHSLSAAKKHFSQYPGAAVYFSLRIETLCLGSWAFWPPFSVLAAQISRFARIGGELVAFVPHSLVRQQSPG